VTHRSQTIWPLNRQRKPAHDCGFTRLPSLRLRTAPTACGCSVL
jgi:hypothetical protein